MQIKTNICESINKMFNKFPKRTGIYHIKDRIENLKIKITLRRISSLLNLPKFDYNKAVSTNWNVQRKLNESNYEETEIKEVCIKWQEKLLSVFEEELYRDSKNCVTQIQKKYHDWLRERDEEAEAYLDDDTNSSRRKRKKSSKKERQESRSERKLKPIKQTNEIHTYIDEDNFKPKDMDEKKAGNPKTTTTMTNSVVVHMYIYATIDVDTQLVHLQWYPQENMLYIYPDFNSFSHNPYFIEMDKDFIHLYAYGVENISKTRPFIPGGDLNLYLNIPELEPHWRTEEERASLFAMPPKRTRRISLLLELGEASNFENDNIHVRYHIHLPANTIHEEGLLEASTHSSSMSDSGIHHFGYNWQLTFLCEEDYNDADFLHIYFEVISIDSWERERMEGYAYFTVNFLNTAASSSKMAAAAKHRLQCLRPVDSFRTFLERFFIGGRRKFDFVRFFGTQRQGTSIAEGNSEFLCRYGCRMQSTGILEFSCQMLSQTNCELLEPCSSKTGRKPGMTLDDIMLAYREARNRLEALVFK